MTRQTVTVTVRGSDGELSTRKRTVYRSRYGPVLATGWTAKTAFALRDVSAGNLRSMNEWLAMGRAQNIDQLRAAQETATKATPSPTRSPSMPAGRRTSPTRRWSPTSPTRRRSRCIDSALGKALYPETFVLDGSRSACDWGSDRGAIQRGIFAPRRVPRLTRTDYVANSNQSPWLTNPAAPITGYPAVFGDIGTEREPRTRLGLDMIAQRLAGTDGLGPPSFTLPTLEAAMLGNRNYSAELGRADVVAMCRAHPVLTAGDGKRVDVRAACDTLAGWDGRADAGSRGEALWETFFDDSLWALPFDPAHPLTTPRGIDGNDPDVQRAFADAVRFGGSDRDTGRARRWAGITLHGCPEEKGCFNAIEA